MLETKLAQAHAALDLPLTTAPLSFAQARLWLMSELHPASTAYHLRTAYALSGELDLAALAQSLREIAVCHEVLRTTFEVVNGEPVQIVGPPRDIPIPLHDLVDTPPARRAAVIKQRLFEEGARPFDLRCGPLLRVAVFRVAPREHVLSLVMHHIVFDDASFPVFNSELTALYAKFHRNLPLTLAPLPIQYADFAAWQRESMQTDELTRQTDYWRTQLAGAPVRVELPLDRPRPAIQRFHGALKAVTLSGPVSDRVRELGRASGTTLFMTLLAAFNVLLYRYTGQTDLIVGAPIANRTRTELEPLIGFFVNTVALRTRLNGDSTFSDVLRGVREAAISAYDNQDVPFEHVIAELHPERSLSGTPLVNVMFFVRADLGEPLTLDGLRVERLPLESTTSKFDLSLRITERAGDLVCSLQYDTDLFDAPKIQAMLEHFANLVASITAAPDTAIAQLPMLAEAERERLVVDWNATATPYAGDQTLTELFERQVERTPEAVAVAGEGEAGELTYRELNAAANRLAAELRANGLQPGDTVGIGLDRSTAAIVCTLAVVKAGGVYLPLDPRYPHERVTYMLRDSGARIVLARPSGLPSLSSVPGIAVLDPQAATVRQQSAANHAPAGTSDDVVYVMYTSGSTGRPKGVPISGRAVSRLVTGSQFVMIAATDVVAQVSNFSFDAFTFELWGALLHGARLEIIAHETVLSPDAFAAALKVRGVTVMFLTTALFGNIAAALPAAFAGLRCLLVGGETVDPAAARAVLEAGPPAQLFDVYGPTESTTFATAFEMTLPVPALIPIGRPIANTQAYILDADRNPLPPGIPGQLYLGGPGLTRGYLNDDALTARKFIPHPFAAGDARLYATGDVARYRHDGNIEYLGRVDRQVKIRGFRIEPEEVELALKGFPAVAGAVVVVRSDASGDARLVAYVVDGQRPERTTEIWRKLLASVLPDYMLPNLVVPVPGLPTNANGKLDTSALPNPLRPAAGVPERPFQDRRYQQLAGLWRAILGVDAVGLRDNFFDLGGHSLLAMRLVSEVSATFGLRVPLAAFLMNPTIEHLAELLQDADGTTAADSPLMILRETGSRPPFFFFHGDLVGGGYYARKLARQTGEDQPFYVLAPHGLDGTPMPSTIEDMAHEYVRVIQGVRPNGPYLLGGFSGGGLVAFEVARQLQAASGTVSNVILLDAPGTKGRFSALVAIADRAAGLLRIDERRRNRLFGQIVRTGRAAILAALAVVRPPKERRRAEEREDEIPALVALRQIIAGYIPRRYRGRVTLLVPEAERVQRSASIAGWKAVAQTLDVGTVPGEHYSCVTRFIDETAARFSGYLIREDT